jgi:hypothetical protein
MSEISLSLRLRAACREHCHGKSATHRASTKRWSEIQKAILFGYSIPDPVTAELHDIDLRAGGSIGAPDPLINPQSRNQCLFRSLVREAITSSQLEGAVTTREVAKETNPDSALRRSSL